MEFGAEQGLGTGQVLEGGSVPGCRAKVEDGAFRRGQGLQETSDIGNKNKPRERTSEKSEVSLEEGSTGELHCGRGRAGKPLKRKGNRT